MQAKELMTADVVTVGPDTPVKEIAGLLLAHHISAVPVIDAAGAPIGMVSEGDLIGRNETEQQARVDWWLALLAEGEALHPDFVASLRRPERRARDIMTTPLVTVEETAEASDIARLLSARRIKRVPVVRGGRVVGIVSRADLLKALVAETSVSAKAEAPSYLAGILSGLDQHFLHRHQGDLAGRPALGAPGTNGEGTPTVEAFRALAEDFVRAQRERRDEMQRAVAERHHQQVQELIEQHVAEASWREMLHHAREAAERGETQFLLLRFPNELCSDGGRAVNAPLPEWPSTLRGEAAEIYRRWEEELKPRGFRIAARVLEFPGGLPGDVGLYLSWDE